MQAVEEHNSKGGRAMTAHVIGATRRTDRTGFYYTRSTMAGMAEAMREASMRGDPITVWQAQTRQGVKLLHGDTECLAGAWLQQYTFGGKGV
jgi:hypothetical protein